MDSAEGGLEYIWLWVIIEPKNRDSHIIHIKERNTCLLLSTFCLALSKIMENTLQFHLMQAHSIPKPVDFRS